MYHVTMRGNARELIHRDEADYQMMFALLARVAKDFDLKLRSWCQMPNHIHLDLKTPEPNLAAAMRQLFGKYARRFNLRHGRSNHVFGQRYYAVLLEEEAHFLEVPRYVVRNPERGGLCELPEEWPWSSYRASVGLAPAPAFLDLKGLLGPFGGDREAALARGDQVPQL